MEQNKQKIEISVSTMLKFFAIIIALIILYIIRDILIMLFVVLILVAAIDPFVNWAETYKIPRWVSALFVFLAIFIFIGVVFSLMIPPIINEITVFSINFPSYVEKITPYYYQISNYITDWQNILSTISKSLSNIGTSALQISAKIFGGVASFITMLILAFYLLLERDDFRHYFINITTKDQAKREAIIKILAKIALKMGAWIRGQIAISLIIGVSTAVILAVLGNPYAVTIGLIAALVEIIPIIGPVITATLAVISTMLIGGGWIQALIVLGAFMLLQQVESQFLVPKIMSKAVELSPAIIIIALLIGGKLAGIPGAILAIPVASGIAVFIQEYPKLKTAKSA